MQSFAPQATVNKMLDLPRVKQKLIAIFIEIFANEVAFFS